MLLLSSLFDVLMIKDKKQLTVFLARQLKDRLTSFLLFVLLTFQLNKENKTLKRISMLYMAKLGPEIITEEINIDEDESSTDTEATSESCNSVHCQQQIKGEHCCWSCITRQGRSCVKNSSVGLEQRLVLFQVLLLGVVRIRGFPGMTKNVVGWWCVT